MVRYRAGYPIGKFGTVKQNRGPNVVRCRAFCREKCLRCKPNLDPTRTMALTACACWERSIGWPSAKLRVQMVQGDGGSGGVGTQWLDLLTRPIRTVASRS